MGLLTFTEMQSQVRSMLGGRQDQDALIMRGLQFAQHYIARVFNFDELFTDDETTLSNNGSGYELSDATITMPSTMKKLHSLSIVDDSSTDKLEQISADRWEQLIGDTSVYDRGRPTRYVLYGKTIYVHHSPDDTYTIRRLYTVWPTEIELNAGKDAPLSSTTTSLLDHKDDLLVTYAVVWCYLALGNQERANYFFSVFNNLLKQAGAFDVSKPDLSIASGKQSTSISDHTVPTFGGR